MAFSQKDTGKDIEIRITGDTEKLQRALRDLQLAMAHTSSEAIACAYTLRTTILPELERMHQVLGQIKKSTEHLNRAE